MSNKHEKILEKGRQNGSKHLIKINGKSTAEKGRQNDAKMLENGCPKWSRNLSNVVKIEVQKTIENTSKKL